MYEDERGAPYRIRFVDGGYYTARENLYGYLSGAWDEAFTYPCLGSAGYACEQLIERDMGRHIGMPYPQAPVTGGPTTWLVVDRDDQIVFPPALPENRAVTDR